MIKSESQQGHELAQGSHEIRDQQGDNKADAVARKRA